MQVPLTKSAQVLESTMITGGRSAREGARKRDAVDLQEQGTMLSPKVRLTAPE
jgi:hypothetical protein